VDTNFTWRAPRGLRINGGTSTGRAVRDLCRAETLCYGLMPIVMKRVMALKKRPSCTASSI
jgi:hypothetical protein